MPSPRPLIRMAAVAVAVAGALVAALAPARWFDWVLAELIGSTGPAGTTPAQRVMAVAGALLAAVSVLRWTASSRQVLPRPGRWRLWVAAIPFALLGAQNLSWAGAALGLWNGTRGLGDTALTV